MSGPEDTDLPGGWEAAAAEYVLGLLPEDELRAFEARLSQDRDLQQDVEAWSEYFAALTDPVEAVAPPPQLLRRIEDRLFGRKRPSLWQQILPYLLGAVAAAAIAWAAMFSGMLDFRNEPDLWADLETPSRGLVLLAHYAPESQTFMMQRDAGDYPAGRSLEIWMIPEEGDTPISLGLVAEDGLTRIPVPQELAEAMDGAAIAISEEEPGGSPTGVAQGPILSIAQMAPRDE
ncbi:MAG: anti-sigma factor [Salipiger thiooxidans]|uniref:anti-sigma factor n=1 Tax=Salipiger thiooxidans TaxID=282683 RepID=UPI001CFA8B45|nr:anti-sigma factor [Salipiger thiooxidans]